MAVLVLDASVLIALLDGRDALHERAVAALRRAGSDDLVVPASAYAEILVGPFRRGRDDVREFEETLARVPVRIEPITAAIAREGARLRARHTVLRLGDALVLATAAVLNAPLLTADRGLTRYGRVRSV